MIFQTRSRACLEKAFCKMYVTICGRFCTDEGVVTGYDNRIWAKDTANWGVQVAGMIFQTRSNVLSKSLMHLTLFFPHICIMLVTHLQRMNGIFPVNFVNISCKKTYEFILLHKRSRVKLLFLFVKSSSFLQLPQ